MRDRKQLSKRGKWEGMTRQRRGQKEINDKEKIAHTCIPLQYKHFYNRQSQISITSTEGPAQQTQPGTTFSAYLINQTN